MKTSGAAVVALVLLGGQAPTLREQNEALFRELQQVHGVSDSRMAELRGIFARSGVMGQGNPAVTRHPMTPEETQAKLNRLGIRYANPEFEKICGGEKYMAPLYDPRTQRPPEAKSCIDQFEFPDIPAAYPVIWVKAREAAQICSILGKRLCDAHEWEGACAGSLEPADYRFDLAKGLSPAAAVERMRIAHNQAYNASKSWSYGPAYQKGICAASSQKSPGCDGGGPKCGSNTFPAGSFPDCHSALQVYDLNGNAAEHMNLPLRENEMASKGSRELGYTEMKGSWFIFDSYPAHPDWCRWRAPYWHGSRVMDEHSHANYHLGFRCCKTLD